MSFRSSALQRTGQRPEHSKAIVCVWQQIMPFGPLVPATNREYRPDAGMLIEITTCGAHRRLKCRRRIVGGNRRARPFRPAWRITARTHQYARRVIAAWVNVGETREWREGIERRPHFRHRVGGENAIVQDFLFIW